MNQLQYQTTSKQRDIQETPSHIKKAFHSFFKNITVMVSQIMPYMKLSPYKVVPSQEVYYKFIETLIISKYFSIPL